MGSFELDVLCHVDYHFIRSCANTAKHSQYSVFIAHLYTTIIWSGPKKRNTMMIIFLNGGVPMFTEKNQDKNKELRAAMQKNGLFQWEVAERIGVSDSTLSRMLRHELPPEQKADILRAIESD